MRPQGIQGIGNGLLIPPGPSRDQSGHIVLSRLSSGQIDRGKDIFQPDLLGIKTNGEKVLPGVIGYCHDPPEGGDGGAHGVGAAASHKPSLLHQARHPEIYALAVHEESFVLALATRPSVFIPPGLALHDDYFNFTLFFLSAYSDRAVPLGGPVPRRPVSAILAKWQKMTNL